jgi:hypothetical protein
MERICGSFFVLCSLLSHGAVDLHSGETHSPIERPARLSFRLENTRFQKLRDVVWLVLELSDKNLTFVKVEEEK